MNHEFPPRVTLCEDGIYRWTGVEDKEQSRTILAHTAMICTGIVLASCVLVVSTGGLKRIIYVLPVALVMYGLLGLFWLLEKKAPGPTIQKYEMTDDHIKFVLAAKTSTFIEFKTIKGVKIVRSRNVIELRRKFGTARVFVNPDDLLMVRDHIMRYAPEGTEMMYD